MIKSKGIKIFDNLPIPSSTSLFVINQNKAHNRIVQMNVGNMTEKILFRLEVPPTDVLKNRDGSAPHPNVKLFNRYTRSQLKITI